MTRKLNLARKRFGNIFVLHEDTKNHSQDDSFWVCLCICGNETTIRGTDIKNGRTKSCGCLRREFLMSKREENHYRWMGDKVGYQALHARMRKKIEKPQVCIFCKQEKELQLMNKSGKYKTVVSDWMWGCESCHRRYDKGWLFKNEKWFKVCKKCCRSLEVCKENFNTNKAKAKGLGWQTYCKICMKTYVKNSRSR